jgi:hypothetical protein
MQAATPRSISRISIEDVNRLSQQVAGTYQAALQIVGVMPTEGGGDRVEVFVSIPTRAPEGSRRSVVVDRAVSYAELESELFVRLGAVLSGA